MKRFPNGVDKPAFYQQRHPEAPPPGVRREVLPERHRADRRGRPARSADRRIADDAALHDAARGDFAGPVVLARGRSAARRIRCAIDLDPGDGAGFDKVLDVARWVKDELDSARHSGVPKTSGSRGLHIYIPLPKKTTYESGQLLCQIDRDDRRRRSIRRSRRSSAWCKQAAARHGLRRLPAEHPRQDAGVRRTRRARATTPACRRRSPGRRSREASIRATSRSARHSRASARSAICGQNCARCGRSTSIPSSPGAPARPLPTGAADDGFRRFTGRSEASTLVRLSRVVDWRGRPPRAQWSY